MSPRAHEKGLEIGWAADAGLAPILADEGRLKQILLNFAGNAVKFVETGGVLIAGRARAADGPRALHRLRHRPGRARGRASAHLRGLHPGRPGRATRGQAARGWAWPSPRGSPRRMGGEMGVGGAAGRGARTSGSRRRSSRPAPAPGRAARRAAAWRSSRRAPSCARRPARQIEACGGRRVRAERPRGCAGAHRRRRRYPDRPGAGGPHARLRAAGGPRRGGPAEARGARPHRAPIAPRGSPAI